MGNECIGTYIPEDEAVLWDLGEKVPYLNHRTLFVNVNKFCFFINVDSLKSKKSSM